MLPVGFMEFNRVVWTVLVLPCPVLGADGGATVHLTFLLMDAGAAPTWGSYE